MLKKIIIIISVIFILIIIRLYQVETARTSNRVNKISSKVKVQYHTTTNSKRIKTESLPAYKIIRQEKLHNLKFSIDIRIFDKLNEQQLRAIATEIKGNLNNVYERIFIVYYLPEMVVGNGGWATSHFNPDLKIEILGLTIEQEENIFQSNQNANRNVIGTWIDESPYAGCLITIFRNKHKIYLEKVYADGTSSQDEIQEISVHGQTRFKEIGSNDFGEYLIIDTRGNLGFYDNKGLIFSAIKS